MFKSSTDGKSKDSTDFTTVYKRFEKPIRVYLGQFVKDAALAEELMQETFIKFFRTQEAFDASRSVGAWLKTIARNVFIDWKRSGHLPEPDADQEAVRCDRPNPETLSIMRSAWKQKKRVFRKLTRAQRRVLWLRAVRQLSYDEIAENLNMSLAAVKSAIHRIRLTLEAAQADLAFAY